MVILIKIKIESNAVINKTVKFVEKICVQVEVTYVTIVNQGKNQSLNKHRLSAGREKVLKTTESAQGTSDFLAHMSQLGASVQRGIDVQYKVFY